jgi:hypothetical protein
MPLSVHGHADERVQQTEAGKVFATVVHTTTVC